jgi:molybdopterin-containing oxidoreductase family membrane subunit
MGKIGGTMLCLYMFFKLIDTWYWAAGILPQMGFTFDQMFYQVIYGKWLLWTELIVCGVLPAIMLMIPSMRKQPFFLYLAGILTCTGITINRYVFTVQTIALPVMPFDKWEIYIPNWAEWAPSVMIVAYGFLVLSLSYRYLPVFPQERKLNS